MDNKKSKNKPRNMWQILMLFAAYKGRLDKDIKEEAKRVLYDNHKIDINNRLGDYTKELNKHLRELFGIKDSIYQHHYNKKKAYITKIEFKPHLGTFMKNLNDEIAHQEDQQTLHETEAKDVQDKLSIPDYKRLSDSKQSDK
jgi:hypothetical protein